jgi:hypothetical protein
MGVQFNFLYVGTSRMELMISLQLHNELRQKRVFRSDEIVGKEGTEILEGMESELSEVKHKLKLPFNVVFLIRRSLPCKHRRCDAITYLMGGHYVIRIKILSRV